MKVRFNPAGQNISYLQQVAITGKPSDKMTLNTDLDVYSAWQKPARLGEYTKLNFPYLKLKCYYQFFLGTINPTIGAWTQRIESFIWIFLRICLLTR